jgi:hypothetical protein
MNILVELTRSNITLNLHNNLRVFSHVSQLNSQTIQEAMLSHTVFKIKCAFSLLP